MTNNWQQIWNNRKNNLGEISAADEQALIIELKRIVGWDGFGKGTNIAFEEFRKEYEFIKENLVLPKRGGVLCLR